MELYQRADDRTTADAPQPASFRRQVEAVKEAARIEDVASDYGAFRLMGAGRLLGRCVSPDHEDKTPSMHIFTNEQRFKCFGIGCGEHGDVLDLVQRAEGCELWEAMMILSTRYGIPLPERPQAWFNRQKRQAPIRAKIEDVRTEVLMRRLFRFVFEPMISAHEDPDERAAMAADLWRDVLPLAARMAEDRRGAE